MGLNPLELLGEKHKPTKRLQNFLPYYWTHFRDLSPRCLLEIGVQSGNSLAMWREFFPLAEVYGIDIKAPADFIGNQADTDFLQEVIDRIGQPDIIIDDGSHKPEHQLTSFEFLFPHLTTDGIYVIEDIGGCVGDFELKTVNHLKELIDNIMYWPAGLSPREWSNLTEFPAGASWLDRNVVGIAFYRWIAFIFKGMNPRMYSER